MDTIYVAKVYQRLLDAICRLFNLVRVDSAPALKRPDRVKRNFIETTFNLPLNLASPSIFAARGEIHKLSVDSVIFDLKGNNLSTA